MQDKYTNTHSITLNAQSVVAYAYLQMTQHFLLVART